jgi:hypothetical protein
METFLSGLTALLVFLGLSSPVLIIGLVYYFIKRLEHKQILAAIEKGTPLSELRPPKQKQNGALWIRNLTSGIMLIIIGLAYLIVGPGPKGPMQFAAVILFGLGVALIIRGLLYRKYQPQSQPPAKNYIASNKKPVAVSKSGTLPQADEDIGQKD